MSEKAPQPDQAFINFLSEDEQRTILRFEELLSVEGIHLHLRLALAADMAGVFAIDPEETLEQLTENLTRELKSKDDRRVKLHNAAPSLALLARLAWIAEQRQPGIFPEGSVPTSDTVARCLQEFHRTLPGFAAAQPVTAPSVI